jgi:hypothetical protein
MTTTGQREINKEPDASTGVNVKSFGDVCHDGKSLDISKSSKTIK